MPPPVRQVVWTRTRRAQFHDFDETTIPPLETYNWLHKVTPACRSLSLRGNPIGSCCYPLRVEVRRHIAPLKLRGTFPRNLKHWLTFKKKQGRWKPAGFFVGANVTFDPDVKQSSADNDSLCMFRIHFKKNLIGGRFVICSIVYHIWRQIEFISISVRSSIWGLRWELKTDACHYL